MGLEHSSDSAMLFRSLKHTDTRLPQRPDDIWDSDAPFYDRRGRSERGHTEHDDYFASLLKAAGVRDFQELMEVRTLAGLPNDVLELFGSGYFVADYLPLMDSVTGMRLRNSSQELVGSLSRAVTKHQDSKPELAEMHRKAIDRIQTITSSPKWNLVQGNAYRPETWNTLDAQNIRRGIPEYGVIVAKPEGAFFADEIFDIDDRFGDKEKEEQRLRTHSPKFLRLLDRTYNRLSPEHGMLFTEVPGFIARTRLDDFVGFLNQEVEVNAVASGESDYFPDYRRNLLIVRRPNSLGNIEQLARNRFK